MKTRVSENIIKTAITRYLAVACLVAASATYGQDRVQSPEAAGLTPVHGTIYVNDDLNDNPGGPSATGVWGVDFTDDHTVLVSLSDTTSGTAFAGMGISWTLYDTNGNRLVPPTVITNVTGASGDATRTSTWRSFFRTNGTPTPNNIGQHPRVRGNRFGSGFVVGARGDRIGLEIPALLDINTDVAGPLTVGSTASGFPVGQLINNSGTAGGAVVSAMTDEEAEASGAVNVHGAEILANGNIVLVGESRQTQELVDRFGGSFPANHVVYRVVKPNGDVVKAYSLASEANTQANQFNAGVGVTSNGFAIRFGLGTGSTPAFRLFDNDGNPTSTNIIMAEAVGAFLTNGFEPTAGGGIRGDGVGWRGNYKDAYVHVCVGDQFSSSDSRGPVYVTVYNADGSVRYHRPAFDVGSTNNGTRVDGAIHPDGRVVIAIGDTEWAATNAGNSLILGRIFDPAGNPTGPHFSVSELETPLTKTDNSSAPRVGWRDNYIAFTWQTPVGPVTGRPVIGYRLFKETTVSLSIAPSAGNMVLSWPTNATGFTLRSKGDLSSSTWQTNSPAPVINGSMFTVTEPVGPSNKFYQLIK